MQLHAEQGIIGTSWEDIARRAGVALATVYRHFPSLNELVPACGAMAEGFMQPPRSEQAETLFEGVDALGERIGRLVGELCAFYERAGSALLLASREGHLVAPLGEWAGKLDRTREILVRAALRPGGLDERAHQLVNALVSFSFWQALIDAGVSRSDARQVVRSLASSCVRDSAP